jgi:hypothetical protein
MSVTFVQSKSGGGSASATFTSNNTAGNLIVCGVEVNDHDTNINLSISDTVGNTYTAATGKIERGGSGVGNQTIQLFYAKNIGSGANTVTASDSLSTAFHDIFLAEYSGCDTSAPLGAHAAVQGTSTTPDSGTLTVTVGNLIVGFNITGAGITGHDSSYSLRNDDFGVIELIDKVAASTSEHPNWTIGSSVSWAVIGAEFKAAGAATTTIKSQYIGGQTVNWKI